MRRKPIIFAAVLGGLLLIAGLWGGRAWRLHAAISPGVPELPAMSNLAEELLHRLVSADASARGYIRPVAALAELSRLYHANGFFDEADSCYRALEKLEPTVPQWPHLRASIASNYGRLEEAEPLFRRAAELAPTYEPSRLRRGDVLLKENRPLEAAKVYSDVLAIHPGQPYALLGLARCAIAKDDWPHARDHLIAATQADPNFVGGLSLLAAVYEHLGDTADEDVTRERVGKREFVDLLDPWLESLLDDCYDPYQLSVAAAVVAARGDLALAKRRLQRAIDFSQRPAPYYRQLAGLLGQLGEVDAARAAYEHATSLAPTDSDSWTRLVNLLDSGGDRPAAYRAVAEGLRQCPDSRALHQVHGHLLNQDGNYAQAIAEFSQAKRLQPSEADPYIELAAIHFRLGEIDAGMAELRDVMLVQPEHPAALVVMAGRAIENGDEAGAAQWLVRVRKQRRIPRPQVNKIEQQFQAKFGRLP